jgi:hypothetical protein
MLERGWKRPMQQRLQKLLSKTFCVKPEPYQLLEKTVCIAEES